MCMCLFKAKKTSHITRSLSVLLGRLHPGVHGELGAVEGGPRFEHPALGGSVGGKRFVVFVWFHIGLFAWEGEVIG